MKRIISIMLIFALTLSMCALASGCKSKEKDDITDALKGKTIHYFTRSVVEPTEGTEVGDLRIEALRAAEEKYGCKVEFSSSTDMTSMLLTAASSGQKLGDVVQQVSHQLYYMMTLGDYFWSIEELGGDPEDEIFNQDVIRYSKYNGKTYGWWYDPTRVSQVMAINKTIVERNGGKMPYDLVEDRKWTFDAWKEIMLLGNDPNSGILGGQRDQASVYTYLSANDTGLYTEENGVHKANTNDPKLFEVLDFLTTCTVTDKIYNGNSPSWDYAQKQFAKGMLTTALIGLYVAEGQLPTEMTDEWGLMPVPIGPSATEYKNIAVSCNAFCIQKVVDLEYAKALFALTNDIFAYPIDALEGVRGSYESFCPDKESLENLMLIQQLPLYITPEFTRPDLRKYTDNTSIMNSLTGASNGTKPIRSTLDAIAPEIQGVLDEFYKQTPAE